MKTQSIHNIKKELQFLNQTELIDLSLRLGKFKQDNKALLTYLLFEVHDEDGYIASVKSTLDELFEVITLIQTLKISPVPIVLMGSEFWGGLNDWIKNTLLAAGNISAKDLNLFHIVDEPVEAVKIITDFYEDPSKIQPNLTLR